MAEMTEQVALRLPSEVLERLEAHAARMRSQHPGVKLSRADAIRSLLLEALEAAESDAD